MALCKYNSAKCPDEAMAGYSYCKPHHEKNLEYGRQRRAALRAMGKCPLCGEPPAKGRKYCLYCLGKASEANAMAYPGRAELARAYAAQQRKKQKAAGRCQCGAERKPGRMSCTKCLKRRVRGVNRQRWERIRAGMCQLCGKEPLLPGLKIGSCCKRHGQRYKFPPRPLPPNHWWRRYENSRIKQIFWRHEQRKKRMEERGP